MKTLEGWNKSGVNFEKFITPNDEIDSDLYWYFLEVLPPRIMRVYGFLVGEPYTHNNKNEAVYSSFYQSPDGKRFYYGGLKTAIQFVDPSEKKYTL